MDKTADTFFKNIFELPVVFDTASKVEIVRESLKHHLIKQTFIKNHQVSAPIDHWYTVLVSFVMHMVCPAWMSLALQSIALSNVKVIEWLSWRVKSERMSEEVRMGKQIIELWIVFG